MTAYTNIAKPTGVPYTNLNAQGKEQYDQANLTYDESTIFYDGLNEFSYTNVAKPTYPLQTLASYSESNWAFSLDYLSTVDATEIGMNFLNVSQSNLNSCQFFLTKIGENIGSLDAVLYAVTGTYGVDSVPTGSPLATSNSVDISVIPQALNPNSLAYSDYKLITFDFPTHQQLTANTPYVVAIRYGGGGIGNYLSAGGGDSNLPTGNPVQLYVGTSGWQTYTGAAYNFYVSGPITSPYTNIAKPTT